MSQLPQYIVAMASDPANAPASKERMAELADIITAAREARALDAMSPRLKRQEAQAQEELMRRNIRLVISIAQSYKHRMDVEDLIGAGNVAVVKAVKAWAPDIGPLAPWLFRWIRSAMNRAVDAARTIRLPEELAYSAAIAVKQRQALEDAMGREVSLEELSELMETTPEALETLLNLPHATTTLDSSAKGSEGRTTGKDSLGTDPELDPSAIAQRHDLATRLELAMQELTATEAMVIHARFRLDGPGEIPTLLQLGEAMDMSRENIRKLEASALAKLRHPALKTALLELL
jgi:hypothetical protein